MLIRMPQIPHYPRRKLVGSGSLAVVTSCHLSSSSSLAATMGQFVKNTSFQLNGTVLDFFSFVAMTGLLLSSLAK